MLNISSRAFFFFLNVEYFLKYLVSMFQYFFYGEWYKGPLQNWKQKYHMILEFHSWAYIWGEFWFKRIHAPQMHCSTIYNCLDREAT